MLSEEEHWNLTKRWVMIPYLIVAFGVVAILMISLILDPRSELAPSDPLLWFVFGPVVFMLVYMIAFQSIFEPVGE